MSRAALPPTPPRVERRAWEGRSSRFSRVDASVSSSFVAWACEYLMRIGLADSMKSC